MIMIKTGKKIVKHTSDVSLKSLVMEVYLHRCTYAEDFFSRSEKKVPDELMIKYGALQKTKTFQNIKGSSYIYFAPYGGACFAVLGLFTLLTSQALRNVSVTYKILTIYHL